MSVHSLNKNIPLPSNESSLKSNVYAAGRFSLLALNGCFNLIGTTLSEKPSFLETSLMIPASYFVHQAFEHGSKCASWSLLRTALFSEKTITTFFSWEFLSSLFNEPDVTSAQSKERQNFLSSFLKSADKNIASKFNRAECADFEADLLCLAPIVIGITALFTARVGMKVLKDFTSDLYNEYGPNTYQKPVINLESEQLSEELTELKDLLINLQNREIQKPEEIDEGIEIDIENTEDSEDIALKKELEDLQKCVENSKKEKTLCQ